ncbi:thiol reductant ABC exporter subunit CydD [Marinivivus vitaminiproducens]|uniref:thiol reductant ABC exporter subunit CydD n=1 Tax=Marinivivus vitaminiproducens TaxID=3035935 RepID=UPI0027996BEB|nr:thiol reductant ABC exporter subunit CydD [Geminicoccaceae bacterium SCSIO 64248]
MQRSTAATSLPEPRGPADARRWLQARLGPARAALCVAIASGLVGGGCVIGQAWLIASVLHWAIVDGAALSGLVLPFAAMLALLLVRALCVWLAQAAGARAARRVKTAVRDDLVGALRTPWAPARPSGEIASLVIDPVEALDRYVSRFLPDLVLALLLPLAMGSAVLAVNWASGLILMLSAPIIPAFMILIGMGAEAASRRQLGEQARLGGYFLDRVQGLLTLRLYGQEDAEVRRVRDAADGFRRRTMEVLRIAFLSSAVLELFASLAIALLAIYVGFSLLGFYAFGTWGGPMTLRDGLFVLILAPEFFRPLRQMAQSYHDRAAAMAAAGILEPLCRSSVGKGADARRAMPRDTTLRLAGVTAGYAPGEPVLDAVDLTLARGDRLAVTGPSGSGKSTLIAVMLGLIDPWRGEVTIGGVARASLAERDWLARIAWIGQSPHLFHGSVRANVRMAKPDADEADVEAACASAGLADLAASLPQGLETRVGPDGFGLSGGQVRRVALARAFLKDAPVLLLDEPTAGLDRANEAAVLEALARLADDRSVLIATHSMAALAWADRVLHLKDGRLMPIGAVPEPRLAERA